jgi:hypothetical protein
MGVVYSFQPLHTYFHHNQHKTPKWFLHSIVTSETKTSKTQEAIAKGEIISTIVHEHEFAITTKLVELKINERDEPHIVVDDCDNDFTFLVVDSVLRVDREEKKYVLAPVVISDTAVVFAEEHKRHVTEPLKNVVTATTMPSTEKKVMRAVTVRPRQHSHLTFELHDVSIHIFDLGGRFTVVVCPRRMPSSIPKYHKLWHPLPYDGAVTKPPLVCFFAFSGVGAMG